MLASQKKSKFWHIRFLKLLKYVHGKIIYIDLSIFKHWQAITVFQIRMLNFELHLTLTRRRDADMPALFSDASKRRLMKLLGMQVIKALMT